MQFKLQTYNWAITFLKHQKSSELARCLSYRGLDFVSLIKFPSCALESQMVLCPNSQI